MNASAALVPHMKDGDDGAVGIKILKEALEEPIRWIAHNAGVEGSVIVEHLKNNKPGIGYDATRGDYVDMVERGVIDPAKVVRTALENAASVAVMILTTEALVADIPEKEKVPAAPMPPEY